MLVQAPADESVNGVTSLFWSYDFRSLIMIKDSGKLFIWHSFANKPILFTDTPLVNCRAVLYLPRHNAILYTNETSTGILPLYRIENTFGFSIKSIITFQPQAKVAMRPHPPIGPAQYGMLNAQATECIIASNDQVWISSADEVIRPTKKVCQVACLFDYFVVFVKGERHYLMQLYDQAGTFLAETAFPHKPLTVNVTGDKPERQHMVVTCDTKFVDVQCVVGDDADGPCNFKFGPLTIVFALFTDVQKFSKAIYMGGDIAVLHRNHTLRLLSNNTTLSDKVSTIWASPPFIFIIKTGETQIYSYEINQRIRYQYSALYSDNVTFYELSFNQEIGKVALISHRFLSSMMSLAPQYALQLTRVAPNQAILLLGEALVYLGRNEDRLSAMTIIGRLPAHTQAAVIHKAVIRHPESCASIAVMELKWPDIFSNLDILDKAALILDTDPMTADRLANLVVQPEERTDILREAITNREIYRGFTLGNKFGIDFCAMLKEKGNLASMPSADLVALMRAKAPKKKEDVRFFGSSLICAGLEPVALALFIARDDREKIAFLNELGFGNQPP